MEDVQKLARHSNISTTIDIYSHVSPQRIDKVLDIQEKVFFLKKYLKYNLLKYIDLYKINKFTWMQQAESVRSSAS